MTPNFGCDCQLGPQDALRHFGSQLGSNGHQPKLVHFEGTYFLGFIMYHKESDHQDSSQL